VFRANLVPNYQMVVPREKEKQSLKESKFYRRELVLRRAVFTLSEAHIAQLNPICISLLRWKLVCMYITSRSKTVSYHKCIASPWKKVDWIAHWVNECSSQNQETLSVHILYTVCADQYEEPLIGYRILLWKLLKAKPSHLQLIIQGLRHVRFCLTA
jgi:hypothetical protein